MSFPLCAFKNLKRKDQNWSRTVLSTLMNLSKVMTNWKYLGPQEIVLKFRSRHPVLVNFNFFYRSFKSIDVYQPFHKELACTAEPLIIISGAMPWPGLLVYLKLFGKNICQCSKQRFESPAESYCSSVCLFILS